MNPNDPGEFGPGGWLTPVADEFLKAYEASLPPDVRAACHVNPEADRFDALRALAIAGAVIDVPIMLWMWHPYWTMLNRASRGWSWVPSALMGGSGEGGGSGPVPVGAVRVIDPSDRSQWPAPFTPAVPPPAQGSNYVGARNPVWDMLGLGLGYNANKDVVRLNPAPGESRYMLSNGQEHPEDGATFVFRVQRTMIGESYFFTLKS